ncbi:MAG: alpha/beta hydrolase [Pseudobacteriovorax sp.]|nr:alpha/beta hydrolase [Pseudobacteriovorax sp.]
MALFLCVLLKSICFGVFSFASMLFAYNTEIVTHDSYKTEIFTSGSQGEVLLMVPGYSIPADVIWQKQLRSLSQKFTVVTFNHIHRGRSQTSSFDYSLESYVRHVNSLIKKLDLKQFHLMALSMGGPIAAEIAMTQSIKSLSLLCPAGVSRPSQRMSSLIKIPWLGELLMKVIPFFILNKTLKSFRAPEEKIIAILQKQFQSDQYFQALLATTRRFPFEPHLPRYSRLSKLPVPKAIAWGTKDEVLPYEGFGQIKLALPTASAFSVPDQGHNLPYNAPHVVEMLLNAVVEEETEH